MVFLCFYLEALFIFYICILLIYIYLTVSLKYYNQQQTTLLPYWFKDLIPEKHPVSVIDQIAESPTTFKSFQQSGKYSLSYKDGAQSDAVCLYDQCLFFP
jgi:hypothetical protein